MRRLSVLLFVVAVAGVTLAVYLRSQTPRSVERRVEYTTNKQRDWWVDFFHRAESSLFVDDAGAHFRTTRNGRGICLGDPGDPQADREMTFVSEFLLSQPGEKFWSPDHHGSAVFTVKRITSEGVVLGYNSSFDGTSFGDNVFSIDEGEITLQPFQNPLDGDAK